VVLLFIAGGTYRNGKRAMDKSIRNHKKHLKMNRNQKIATANLTFAALLLIASIPFEALRVMAVIVFCSALGIFAYHVIIKGEIRYSPPEAYRRLARVLAVCLALSVPLYFIFPTSTFLPLMGAVFALGGIAGIYDLSRPRMRED
jgi:uncharacterized membrane protein